MRAGEILDARADLLDRPRVSDHKHVLGEASKGASGHSERHCVIDGCNHHVERIYINAFIKGPAGAPLIVSDKVYELGR
jgi:hypothetical protein